MKFPLDDHDKHIGLNFRLISYFFLDMKGWVPCTPPFEELFKVFKAPENKRNTLYHLRQSFLLNV